jgi:HD-like signal output (HDOD) protein
VAEFLTRISLVEKLASLKPLNEQFQSDNPQFQELFPVIEADPELLKRFLKFSNCGWFNSRIKVESPYMAYTRYGTEGFYKLSLAAFLAQGIGEIGTRYKIWPHLESVARTGETVAAQFAPKYSEDIFAAGLLHDAVVPSMERELTDYLYFLECAMDLDPFVTRLENSAHNFDHAQAAGEIAAALSFKPHVVAAITHHHSLTLTCVPEGRSRALLALLLITKRILALRRTDKRVSFETPSEKKLLEEISLILAVTPNRIQLTVRDIVDDLRLRDA